MRAIKIGDIELENGLWIKEEFYPRHVQAKSFTTIGGGGVVFESVKRNSLNYITLDSKESGWIRKETLQKILFLSDDVGVEVDLIFDDGGSVRVRFAHEKGEVIRAEAIYEGSKWYRVEISLCRV